MKAQAKRKAFEEANLPLPLQPAVLQNFDMVQPVLQTYPAEPAPVPTKKQKVSEGKASGLVMCLELRVLDFNRFVIAVFRCNTKHSQHRRC